MLLTHESKVELDYLSLFNIGIHVPEIGSAILIKDEKNLMHQNSILFMSVGSGKTKHKWNTIIINIANKQKARSSLVKFQWYPSFYFVYNISIPTIKPFYKQLFHSTTSNT